MNKFILLNIVLFGLLFQNSTAQRNDSENKNVIKIGLLVNDQTSSEAQKAAELAVEIANKSGDFKGKQFKLVTRSMEGPWGTGSKETVNLVFNEKVWAILGSHDGRNAHLAEQVIAKTRVVLLSAWSSDPTLSQAYVPWFYNCVPNDMQQAETLINNIAKTEKSNKIAVVVQEGYDSKTALKYLKEKILSVGGNEPYVSSFSFCLNNTEAFINRLQDKAVSAIVILGNGEQSWKLFGKLRLKELKLPVFGTVSMLGSQDIRKSENINESNLTVLNSGKWMKSNTLHSENKIDGSRSITNAVAAYAFDGMNVLLTAIKSSGYNRERFYKAMAKTNYEGVTGKIQFDKNGNRLNTLNLVKIADKNPISQRK